MKKEKTNYPVATMSKVLGVSSSGYYKWLNNIDYKTLKNIKIEQHRVIGNKLIHVFMFS